MPCTNAVGCQYTCRFNSPINCAYCYQFTHEFEVCLISPQLCELFHCKTGLLRGCDKVVWGCSLSVNNVSDTVCAYYVQTFQVVYPIQQSTPFNRYKIVTHRVS